MSASKSRKTVEQHSRELEHFIPENAFQNGEYEIWRKFEYTDAKGLRVKLVKSE